MEKKTLSLKVYANFADEFDRMTKKMAGGKGEQFSAAIMAYLAIYKIDKGLASALTDPDLTPQKAVNLILKEMSEITYRRALGSLTDQQKAQLLQDAKRSEEKVFGNQ